MDVNDYLEKGINGGPQLKPDEKRRFLGNFLERCYFFVENKDLNDERAFPTMEHLMQKDSACLYIHSGLPMKIQTQAMQLAKKYNREFMIVTRDTLDSDTVVFVYAAKQAISKENRHINHFFITEEKKEAPKKKSFFQRLFH